MRHTAWNVVVGFGVAGLLMGVSAGCGSSGDTVFGASGGTTTGSATTSGSGGAGHGGGTTTSHGGAGTGGHGGSGGHANGCGADSDCLSPKAPVCDAKTGACVACTPADDQCPKGQVCQGTSCKVGCADDADCSMGGGGDAGPPAAVCNPATHQCVGCTGDATCPAGSICKGDTCVLGCNANHACQDGAECCADACVDLKTDPANCGSCKACPTPAGAHAPPVCSFGQCGFGTCDAGFGDCNGDPSDGCETDLGGQAACACVPGQTYDCYDGPAGTKDLGLCKGGKAVCEPNGVTFGPCVGEILPATETCDDLFDNNCDGAVNEGGIDCLCKPNEQAPCYDGPAGTENVGTCKDGTKTCDDHGKSWGPCIGAVLPAPQLCTAPAQDQNCDGKANENCACFPGDVIDCYGGPPGTQGVGLCKGGKQTCAADGNGYDACVGQVLPQPENCFSPDDENCNGQVNEGGLGCLCTPNSSTSCYDGAAGTLGVGPCKAGTKTCNALGTAYSACQGEVVPAPESCLTPIDDNCNGQINEGGVGCVCVPGATQPCYDGPAGTLGVGLCKSGLQTCDAQGTAWLPTCAGEVTPVAETCLTPGDDDCNGQANEGGVGCVCKPGAAQACYDGPAGTQGVGICLPGTQTCLQDGTGFGACVGEVVPQAETCLTLLDDNCNGQVNEGGISCACKPGAVQGCYDGPAGTLGKGICKGGTQTCNNWGTEWGPCLGEVLPLAESCVAPSDFNCDGVPSVCSGANECNVASGQCVSACSPDLIGNSYVGCDYYPTVTTNSLLGSKAAPGAKGFHFAVAISNTGAKTVNYTVTRGAVAVTSGTIAANSVQVVQLPWITALDAPGGSVLSTNASGGGAYHLVADRPITVYQYNPLEYTTSGLYSYTNDASLLLPVNAWGTAYVVAARNTWSGYSGFYAVVASQAGTVVTLSPSATGKIIKAGGGVSAAGAGVVTLNQGDVLQVLSAAGGGSPDKSDVTGTGISATLPVQVLGGHDCVDVPYNVTWCDHIEEAMFPVATLSKTYIVTSTVGTPALAARATTVRIIATQPNTALTYDPPQAGAPAVIAAAGQYVDLAPSTSSFQVTSNFKILIASYMVGQAYGGGLPTGDPAMAQAVAVDQYRVDYLFHAPTNYEANYVNITAPTGSAVTLDGAAVPLASFSAIGGTGYSLGRVKLSNAGNGNHSVTSPAKVGVSVYGFGQYTSYWYPGGLDLNVIPGQ